MIQTNLKDHWDSIYLKTEIQKLGWYQSVPQPSLDLINDLKLNKDDPILLVGAGRSTLITYLLEQGYNNLIINDISSVAIDELFKTLKESNKHYLPYLKFINEDLTNPDQLNQLQNISLWHDRAVLHFLTNESDQKKYVELMKKLIKKDGYAIIAAFSIDGAKKCSGLDVINYSKEMLENLLGTTFEFIKSLNYTYQMPNGGLRPYIYTVFRKRN